MDLTKEFGQWKFERPGHQASKSRSRRTRGGVEAQEQASQQVLLTNLATLCQEQQKEIDGLRNLVNELTGAVDRLERRPKWPAYESGNAVARTYYQVGEMLRDGVITLWKSAAPCANSHRCSLCCVRTA